jgi:hypothetical protein
MPKKFASPDSKIRGWQAGIDFPDRLLMYGREGRIDRETAAIDRICFFDA